MKKIKKRAIDFCEVELTGGNITSFDQFIDKSPQLLILPELEKDKSNPSDKYWRFRFLFFSNQYDIELSHEIDEREINGHKRMIIKKADLNHVTSMKNTLLFNATERSDMKIKAFNQTFYLNRKEFKKDFMITVYAYKLSFLTKECDIIIPPHRGEI